MAYMKIGQTNVKTVYLGTTEIDKIYLGNILVYSKTINYEEIPLNWTLNQSINSSTGKLMSGKGNATADVITIDSNYDYFVSTTSDVEFLTLYAYGDNGYIGRLGNPIYISDKVNTRYSGTLDKYKLPITSQTTSFRFRVAITISADKYRDDPDAVNRISLFRKLK